MTRVGDTPWTLLDRDGAYEGLLQAVERHREEVMAILGAADANTLPDIQAANERLWNAI